MSEKIDTGELEDGDRIPTRMELAKKYAVSLQVIRDALALLHTDGYVQSLTSQSTFVHRPALIEMRMTDFESDRRKHDAFEVLVRDQGHEADQRLTVETVLAGEVDVPPGLDLDDDERITVRRRLRYVDGVPYAISDSFYPHRLVADSPLASPANITRGARHVLCELGIPMDHHRDRIKSRRAHNRELQLLDIAPGVAVIAHTRVSYTRDGLPMRVLASVLPSDRWNVTYEVAG